MSLLYAQATLRRDAGYHRGSEEHQQQYQRKRCDVHQAKITYIQVNGNARNSIVGLVECNQSKPPLNKTQDKGNGVPNHHPAQNQPPHPIDKGEANLPVFHPQRLQ